jgi:hypothetical protein
MSVPNINRTTTQILFHLDAWINQLPHIGGPDPEQSYMLRRFIYYTYIFLILHMQHQSVDITDFRHQYLAHYRFLMWRLHHKYGTRPIESIYEPPKP